MAKRKIGDVIWLALECAKSDRQSLADAYSCDTSVEAVGGKASIVKDESHPTMGAVDDATRRDFERDHLHPYGYISLCGLCNPHCN